MRIDLKKHAPMPKDSTLSVNEKKKQNKTITTYE